jgi:hypothetical protein
MKILFLTRYGSQGASSRMRLLQYLWWFEATAIDSVVSPLFDDAIFHNYDLHRSVSVRRVYGRRIDRLMAGARLVITGNHYLVDRATVAGARWVEAIPAVVDLVRYASKQTYFVVMKPRIAWIGSPQRFSIYWNWRSH